MNTFFSLIECHRKNCSDLALTGDEYCWAHVQDKQRYKDGLLSRIRSNESLAEWVLEGVDFSGDDLKGVDFSNIFAKGASFAGADCSDASFVRAHLENANFQKAVCVRANFEFAIAGLANFSLADLSSANFSMSNLVGAVARGAQCDHTKFVYSRPGNSDFSGADLSGADITRAIFRRANLTGARLVGCKGVPNLDDAILEGVIR